MSTKCVSIKIADVPMSNKFGYEKQRENHCRNMKLKSQLYIDELSTIK